jgi:hypothetical protein
VCLVLCFGRIGCWGVSDLVWRPTRIHDRKNCYLSSEKNLFAQLAPGGNMLKLLARFGYSLCAAGMVAAIAGATQTRRLIKAPDISDHRGWHTIPPTEPSVGDFALGAMKQVCRIAPRTAGARRNAARSPKPVVRYTRLPRLAATFRIRHFLSSSYTWQDQWLMKLKSAFGRGGCKF